MGKTIKAKVKAKAKAVKEKVKGAAKAKRAVAAALVALALAGCATSDPASRQTCATYGDVVVRVEGTANTVRVTLGDGAIASADSSGSTESLTASPTNDVRPQTEVSVPVNKAGAGQSVGSVLGDAAASAVKGLLSSSDCADGSCAE